MGYGIRQQFFLVNCAWRFFMLLHVARGRNTGNYEQTLDTSCSSSGLTHSVGESWHPHLRGSGEMECLNCTCDWNGIARCRSDLCPGLECSDVIAVRDNCCPVCAYTTDSIQSDDSYRSCDHSGVTYAHGEMYPSTTTGLKRTQQNQCVMCVCLDGDVMCHLKTCGNLTCTTDEQIYSHIDCCMVCRDQYTDIDNTVPHHRIDPELSSASNGEDEDDSLERRLGCYTNDYVYPDRSRWHPIINPFGRMECILCNCSNGYIVCDPVICLADSELPCERPIRKQGACCKTCDNTQVDPGLLSTFDDMFSPSVLHACPMSSANVLVLQADSQKFFRLVFENEQSEIFTFLTWKLKKGKIIDFRESTVATSRAQHIFRDTKFHYSIIGATTMKKVAKFRLKVTKQLNKCDIRCKGKIVLKQMKRLKLRQVEYKLVC